MPEGGPVEGGRYTVQSVARALGVLDVLAESNSAGGWSVTEIAEATGLSKSAAFALLQTLLSAGYVADSGSGQSRRYRLGRALTRLGDLAREQTPIREIARPTLQHLAVELGLSVRLGVRQGIGAVIIDRVDAVGGLRIDLRMGDRELLHCTAVGKAILAGYHDAEVVEILGMSLLKRQTPHTITDLKQLLKHLAVVRERGFAVDDEEDFEGITCIGAGIRDNTGQAVAALSVTTVKARLSKKRIDEIGGALMVGAASVSKALGYAE